MRLLPRTSEMLNLENARLRRASSSTVWSKLIARPNGIILVTGPTGSGKTTTLYGALSRINTPDENIITIEDPVEIQLPGIGQIEVNPKIGLTFAGGPALDPAPGSRTSSWSARSATSRPPRSRSRPRSPATSCSRRCTPTTRRARSRAWSTWASSRFLVASSLVAVLAQRLVRVLCTQCRELYDATPEELAELGLRSSRRRCRSTGPARASAATTPATAAASASSS